MPKTISKDGVYVETQALRDDVKKWNDAAARLREGDNLTCKGQSGTYDAMHALPPEEPNQALRYATVVVDAILDLSAQGISEFEATAESLQMAAEDYERTDGEIF